LAPGATSLPGCRAASFFIVSLLPPSSPEEAAASSGLDAALAALLFETAAVGAALVDRDLRYVRVNDALASMNGLPAAEHPGRTVREVLTPTATAALEPLLRRVIETGEPVLDLPFVADVPGRRRRHFLASYRPTYDGAGAVTGVVALVAERTPAEVALRESEGRLRRVAESGIVGLFFWSVDGGISEANDAFLRMLGYTQADLAAGRVDWRRMTPPEYAASDEVALQELFATGRHGQVVKEYIGKDGRRVPVVVTSALLDGATNRGVCVCLDDTARRAAEAQLARVLMQTPAAVAVLIGPDHVVQSRNEMFLRLLGRRDYVGRPAREAAPELVEQGFLARMDEVYRTGVPYVGREAALMWDRDGEGRLVEAFFDFVYQPLLDAAGAVEGIVVFAVEVTEQVRGRREVEALNAQLRDHAAALHAQAEQLRTSAATLRGFLDHAPVLMGVVELVDDEGRDDIVHVYDNPATDRFFGAVSGGTAGRRATELGVPAALTAEWTRHYRAAEATGAPVAFEYAFEAPEGVRWLAVTASVIGPGPSGRTRFTYVAEDSTARKRAEAERERLLAAEREALALRDELLDAMSDGFAAFDDEWRYTYVNRQAELLLGRASGELLGQVVWDVFPEARTEIAWDAALTARREQRRVEYEYFLAPVGRWIHASVYPVPGGQAAVFRDVSAERERTRERELMLAAERTARAEAELARAEAEIARRDAEAASRAKSEFLAVMSHELRTPLNAIGGYAELLEMGIRGPVTAQQREDLERIQKSQRHLLALINEVLNYARLESGAVTYDIRVVPIGEAIAAAEVLVAPQLRAKGLGYGWSGCDVDLAVRADRDKLQQILLNLLSNAVKFTNAREGLPGRVEVVCSVAAGVAGRVLIEVRDTGIGIPPDKLDAVFEPFVQVDARLTRPHGGTGLGLAISRDLARGMGGDLAVASRVGQGSTFTLTLPRA
jgi:PAS domain S-box-containing protein